MMDSLSHNINMLNDRNKTLTVKERIVIMVNSLRSKGYQDDVIRHAVRQFFPDGVVSRQFINRVLVTPIAKGGGSAIFIL